MQKQNLYKKMMKELSRTLADELAESLYNKIVLMRFVPEVEEIERGEVKALEGEEIYEYLDSFKGDSN